MSAVIVRVPASLSNLGPGFDCLGLAVRLYNVIRVERTAKQGELPDVFDEAAAVFFKRIRNRRFCFSCSVREKVPRSRGLGSSATVRLGLLYALNRISHSQLKPSDLFRLCGELEGHPDNAAPACFGGFTVARSRMVQQFDVSRTLKFVLLVPEHQVETSEARRILPRRLARVEAVESCGNACAITAAMVSRNYESLRGNFTDHLHQPFRTKLIPYLDKVIGAAERAGALGAFLSGSGSTIAAVTREHPNHVAAAMRNAARGILARTVVLLADNEGARIIQKKS
jgi:homoserine kinase